MFVIIFERWHVAPSCLKIVLSCTGVCNCVFSLSSSSISGDLLWFLVLDKKLRKHFSSKLLQKQSHLSNVLLFAGYTFHHIKFLIYLDAIVAHIYSLDIKVDSLCSVLYTMLNAFISFPSQYIPGALEGSIKFESFSCTDDHSGSELVLGI